MFFGYIAAKAWWWLQRLASGVCSTNVMNRQALAAVWCCFLLVVYVHATEWSCASSANTGTWTRSTHCTISENNHVAVNNKLEIVGNNSDMSNLITITAANNQRHFYINGVNNKLVLRYKINGWGR